MTYQVPTDALHDALAHAAACAPMECCGLIVDDGVFLPVRNAASELERFQMDMRAFIAISRSHAIQAVVHSHVNFPPYPSHADLAACEKVMLPYVIVSHPTGAHAVIEPSGWKAPLVGREWSFGTHDCFGVVKDGLAELAGITIPDFDRTWEFWTRGEDIIGAGFAKAGFHQVDGAPQHCDVFAMRIRSKIANHLALFIEPDLILHHGEGQLSKREIYSPAAQAVTAMHFRHETLL